MNERVTTPTGHTMTVRAYLLAQWLGWGTAFGCVGAAVWLPWGGLVAFLAITVWCGLSVLTNGPRGATGL